MTGKEIMQFFDKHIEPAEFARCLRRYNHRVCYDALANIDRSNEIGDLKPILEGVFWTEEFADVLDPPAE